MSDFLDEMPEAFRTLFAISVADMSTPIGYVQVELLSFVGPIAVLIYAIDAGVAIHLEVAASTAPPYGPT